MKFYNKKMSTERQLYLFETFILTSMPESPVIGSISRFWLCNGVGELLGLVYGESDPRSDTVAGTDAVCNRYKE